MIYRCQKGNGAQERTDCHKNCPFTKWMKNYTMYPFFLLQTKLKLMSQHKRKPTKELCDQQRLRSACASADLMCLLQPPGYPKRDKCETLPYLVDVQANLSLCWCHRSYCRFCRAMAQILSVICLVSIAERRPEKFFFSFVYFSSKSGYTCFMCNKVRKQIAPIDTCLVMSFVF